ncbi:hypothetical protein N7488_007980 [Penicillium malachiteum]|nr:hypothetical protein N7488_007980 [Penicillium malachiteum]
MTTNIYHDGLNHGFQAGVMNGNIHNLIIGMATELGTALGQTESLDQACLHDLRTTNPHDDKERIKETNGGLLEDSYRWIFDNEAFKQWQGSQSNRLLWVRGDPGKGKTMLLCGIIEELIRLYGDTATISFFFCQATNMRINSATSVVRGLIYSLVENNPSLLRHVRARYNYTGKELFEDVNTWSALISIFTEILKDLSFKGVSYLIVDALDECQNGRRELLDLIVKSSVAHPEIKWVISSRNKDKIIERLDSAPHIAPISLELNEASVDSLAKQKKYDEKITATVKRHLLTNSQGTFLWVALVWKNLDQMPKRHVMKNLDMFPPGLDALYHRMMGQVRDSEDAGLCKQILGTATAVSRPVTLSELSSLHAGRDGFDDLNTLFELIGICGSFLTLRESTVTFVHQSAKDFLTREVFTEIFPNGLDSEHHTIFSQCLNVLSKTLRRDIFGLKLPGISTKDIRVPSPNPLAPANYACVYWVDHLVACKNDTTYRLSLKDREKLDIFMQQKFLHWLEALSILGNLSDGIHAMKRLESLIPKETESDGLLERAQDASRFVQYHRTGIESSPLQVYCSPLVFSPSKSITRLVFREERPDWVLNYPMVEENWSACLQTLEGHSSSVYSIAWSPDGSRLASGSSDNTVRVWDPTTGQSVSTLEGHGSSVYSIAWSPDGSRLASGSDDKIVRIWDPATGQSVSTLEGYSHLVNSIAWSPDGNQIASGSWDMTVRIWDLATGQSVSTLKGHSSSVNSIAWSPDGSQLASGSSDNTVRVWDPTTGQSVSTLEGYSSSVNSIAWSPDGSRLASGSSDNTVRVWDPTTGQSVSTLEGHSSSVNSIAWSPDGNQIASGSWDMTVRIWDLATGQSVSTLEGHSSLVYSITWSPDGNQIASGSWDTTVQIWDPATGQSVSTLKGHSSSVNSIAWSPDGSQLASGSSDNTVRVWDPTTGQSVSTLEGHSSSVNSIAWSPDGSRLASGSSDNTVRVWDPTTGQSVSTLKGHGSLVYSITWSPDGSRLASGSSDNTDPATGQSVSTLERDSNLVNLITWSPDGSRLASGSWDKTVRIWDPATGQSVSTLEGHGSSVYLITWSPDGSRLASGSDNKTVRVWDPTTGQSVSTLKGHSSSVNSITWSLDGSQLASGSDDKTVRIWDPATGQSVSTLEGHGSSVYLITWSLDGSRLASGSSDNTVRVWDPTTGQSVSTLKGHGSSVNLITWSPDGSRLASGSYDNTVRIWSPATGQSVLTLEGHSSIVSSIAWSPDGSRLASGSWDNTVRIWDPATGQSVSTLSTGRTNFIEFDIADPNCLHTDAGTFSIIPMDTVAPIPNSFTHPPQQYGYGLRDDCAWITYSGLNLLWLPSEYRLSSASLHAIYKAKMAIVCSSYRVIFLVLSEQCPIPSL